MSEKLIDDMITELPTNVIEMILACLPLREAVRTCILAKQWRYKWITIPHLTINDGCIVTSSRDKAVMKSKLINFIDRILLLHKGPIEKFKLNSSNLKWCSDVDQWILFLSRNGIKELIFHIRKDEGHKVPSCLFSCKQLNHLEIHDCIFKSPPTFDGFNNLKSLNLKNITFVGYTIESFISSCPLLERLTLVNFYGLTDVKIHAPNLKYLYLSGPFKSLCFQNTQLLATVSICLTDFEAEDDEQSEHITSNLIQFLGCLASIVKLDLLNYFVQFLAVGNVPSMLPNTFNHLKKVGLFDVCFNELNEISVALCLIKSSPKLQILEISAFLYESSVESQPVLELLETQDAMNCSLSELQVVKITHISGERTELGFIKFLLANTPSLETMTVELDEDKVDEIGSRVLKKLVQFRRASPKAEIEYFDFHDED